MQMTDWRTGKLISSNVNPLDIYISTRKVLLIFLFQSNLWASICHKGKHAIDSLEEGKVNCRHHRKTTERIECVRRLLCHRRARCSQQYPHVINDRIYCWLRNRNEEAHTGPERADVLKTRGCDAKLSILASISSRCFLRLATAAWGSSSCDLDLWAVDFVLATAYKVQNNSYNEIFSPEGMV